MNKLGAIICDDCRVLIKYGKSKNKHHFCALCLEKEYVFYMVEEDWLVVSSKIRDSYKILNKYKQLYINLGEL